MLLKGKVVVITGIGPGLGTKLALEAARQGAAGLILASRSSDKLDAAEAAIAALAGVQTQVLKVPCDITKPEDCARLTERSVATFGRIDALVNSAYIAGDLSKAADKGNLDDWRAVMETNVFGTMNVTQSVSAQMKKQKSGAILMISSMVTRKPFYGQAGYAASKGAMNTIVKFLATDLGRHGIRVNAASMGWMWGASVEGYFKYREKTEGISIDEQKAAVFKNIPIGRIPTDDECAKAALFLISDMAAVVTGVCLDVNGGEFIAP